MVVAETVPGQYVVVYVVVIVVKPVGHMSTYEVTTTVVTVSGTEIAPVAVVAVVGRDTPDVTIPVAESVTVEPEPGAV